MANDSLDFVQRGKVSIVRRQYAEAVKICRLGLLAHPTLLEGRLVLGMALTAMQRWDEVLSEMRVALEIDDKSALAWLLRGEALVGKSDYAQAESTLKRAKELDPSNAKADQLLAEIEIARAAGLDGAPAEQTDTRVYPAKAVDSQSIKTDLLKKDAAAAVAVSESTRDGTLEYEDEEATEVDANPAGRIRELQALANQGADLIDSEERATETFVPQKGGLDSYEGPADDDYSERARTPAPKLDPGKETVEGKRSPISQQPAAARLKPIAPTTEPSIPLSSSDIQVVKRQPARLDDDDDEDVQTKQRVKQSEIAEQEVGTRPETPDTRMRGGGGRARVAKMGVGDREPEPREAPHEEDHFPSWKTDAPVAVGISAKQLPGQAPKPIKNVTSPGPPTAPTAPKKSTARPKPTNFESFSSPVVARPPTVQRAKPARGQRAQSLLDRVKEELDFSKLRSGSLGLLVAAFVAVVAAGIVAGLLLREWRMRNRVSQRHELARQKLAAGNYPGFQAAELLYRQILTERDDPQARALRARTLAQMTLEFGDSPEVPSRAVAGLGDDKSQDAQAARIYLALARGDATEALKMSGAMRRQSADALSTYLLGRAELLNDRPQAAVDALRIAADMEARDPLVQHALGVAEAALKHDELAQQAFRRALDANSNHIATIIDRAILQLRRGTLVDRDLARGALEGVVTKLVADSAPGQLARAYLGLAELELLRGDLASARKDLEVAVTRRRDGDVLLAEELARAFVRSLDLDAAEREAKLGAAGSTRLGPRLVLAEVALRRGRPAQALAVLEEQPVTRPDALVARALAQLQLGKREQSRRDAEAALRVQPDLIAARVALARIDIVEGRAERAQRDLERLERGDKYADVAAALGQVAMAVRAPSLERARWWLKEATRRDPLHIDARLTLVQLLHEVGKLDEAREEMRQLLQLNANYRPARIELARLLLDQGETTAARDEFEALAKAEPDAEALAGAARTRLVLGDAPGAEQQAKAALKLLGNAASDLSDEANETLARALVAQHRASDVVTLLRKSAPSTLKGTQLALLMRAYLDLEQHERANEVYSLGNPRAKASLEALFQRARLQIEKGNTASGQSMARQVLSKLKVPAGSRAFAAQRSEALALVGRAQWELGEFRPALKSLSTAVELDAANATGFYYLAMVQEDLHKKDDARKSLESATQIDARYADAHYYLGRARAEAGDARASESFRRYLELAPKGIYADDARRAVAEPAAAAAEKEKPVASAPRRVTAAPAPKRGH